MRVMGLLVLLMIVGLHSTSLAALGDEVFNTAAYDWAVSNQDIIKAARCEATDVELYGKQRIDYEVKAMTIGFFAGKHSHQLLEYQLAFRYVNNYYRGLFAALKNRTPETRAKVLIEVSSKSDCETLNDLPKMK